MTGLIRAELHRILWRRSVVALLVLGFVGAVATTVVTERSTVPVSDGELAVAQEQVDRDRDRCTRQAGDVPQRQVDQCLRFAPSVDSYAYRDQLLPSDVNETTLALTVLLMLVALLATTSYVGAEFSSGSMSNLLLFEPRRRRVWGAKLAVAGLVPAVWGALCLAVLVVPLGLLGRSRDPGPWRNVVWADTLALGLRAAAIVVLAGLLGAALTLVLRSTIATVGAVIGYVVVVEVLLRAISFDLSVDLLASNRLQGFLSGPYVVIGYSTRGPGARHVFTTAPSAVYLGAVLLLVLAVSVASFSRRDVD